MTPPPALGRVPHKRELGQRHGGNFILRAGRLTGHGRLSQNLPPGMGA